MSDDSEQPQTLECRFALPNWTLRKTHEAVISESTAWRIRGDARKTPKMSPEAATHHSSGRRPIRVNLSLPPIAKCFSLPLSQARRADRLWSTAQAVGWPALVDDQARVSGRQNSRASFNISAAPTGLAHDAYAFIPWLSPWATFCRRCAAPMLAATLG